MSALKITRKVPEGAAGQQEKPQSARDRLRARRAALAAGSTRLFVLPGYDGENEELGGQLVARYRRLDYDELAEAFRRDRWVGDDGKTDIVAANAQFLVDACADVFIREPDGTITPLVDGHETTYTVNLDSGESLASILGVEHLPDVRAQLVAAFGDNDLALNEHSGEVHRWMVSMNLMDGEMALGESEAR